MGTIRVLPNNHRSVFYSILSAWLQVSFRDARAGMWNAAGLVDEAGDLFQGQDLR